MAGGVAQGEGPKFKPQYHTHIHTKDNIWALVALPVILATQEAEIRIRRIVV
jgi:hypothetical protein